MAQCALALSAHFEEGMTLQDAVREAAETTMNAALRGALLEVHAHLIEDKLEPHDAFARRPDIFPGVFCQMVRVGWLSGNLVGCLKEYADSQQRAAAMTQRLNRDMLYPALIAFAALGMIAVMYFFVFPQLQQMQADLLARNLALPPLTRVLLSLAVFLFSIPGLLLTGALIVIISALARRFRGVFHRHNQR